MQQCRHIYQVIISSFTSSYIRRTRPLKGNTDSAFKSNVAACKSQFLIIDNLRGNHPGTSCVSRSSICLCKCDMASSSRLTMKSSSVGYWCRTGRSLPQRSMFSSSQTRCTNRLIYVRATSSRVQASRRKTTAEYKKLINLFE